MITGCMHSTPTAGMEILLGLKPIELELEAASLMTSIRLERTKHWINEGNLTKSHVNRLEEIKAELPELQYPQDKSTTKVRMKNLFDIDIGQREDFRKKLIKPRPLGGLEVNCFTDGSKTDDGTGAAYYMMGNDDEWRIFKRQEYIHLGQSTTVFQAEVTAIARAALAMIDANITGRFINFYIDSQSAIRALDSYMVRLKSVADCKRILNKVSEIGNVVTLN